MGVEGECVMSGLFFKFDCCGSNLRLFLVSIGHVVISALLLSSFGLLLLGCTQ